MRSVKFPGPIAGRMLRIRFVRRCATSAAISYCRAHPLPGHDNVGISRAHQSSLTFIGFAAFS
jgi:hypothetical protein